MIIKKCVFDLVCEVRAILARAMLGIDFSGGDYYINGPETLPPPLTGEEEALYVLKMENDASASGILIEHNLRLVVYIAKKFENTGVGLEDLISIGTIGLIKAVNTYCRDRNIKLATYASRCIENEILMYVRKISSHKGDVSMEEPLNVDWDGNELLLSDLLTSGDDSVSADLEKREEQVAVRLAVASLDEREREIIKMRFGLFGSREYTQKEVADMMGISQSYISRLEKKIFRKLRDKLAM